MDTFVVTSKNRATSSLLKKLLKEMKGIERVTALSKTEKEGIALINAINKGHTKKYIDTTLSGLMELSKKTFVK